MPPVVRTRYSTPFGTSIEIDDAPVEMTMGTSPFAIGALILRSDAPFEIVPRVRRTSRRSTRKSPAPRLSVRATGISDGTRTFHRRSPPRKEIGVSLGDTEI